MNTKRYLCCTLIAAASLSACSRDKTEYVSRGDKYFAEKKYGEAIVEYRSAISQDPKYGEARVKLGDAFLANKDYPRAHREYTRAADLLPDDRDAQFKAASILLLGGQFVDAQKRVDRVLELNPKDVDGLLLKAAALGGLKDYDQALKNVNDAIALDPTRSGGYVNLGAIELASGKKAEAEAAYARAVELDPGSAKVRMAYANFKLASGNPAGAESALVKAVELDPTLAAARHSLASLYLATRRVGEAEPHIRAMAAIPGNDEGRLVLADFLAATKKPDESMAILRELTQRPGYLLPAKIRIARHQAASGKFSEAHGTLAEVLKQHPSNAQALTMQAQLFGAERKFEEAAKATASAVAADPNSAEAHYTSAQISLARQEFDAARASLNEVLRLNPRAATAQAQLARLELSTGGVDLAVQLAASASQTQPGDAGIRLSLVRTLIANRDLKRAAAELAPVVSRDADHPAVQAHLGMLRLAEGKPAEARIAFERAIARDPLNGDALRNLTRLDLAEKRIDVARQRLQTSIKAGKSDETLLLAAQVEMAAGQPKAAEDLLRSAIESSPYSLAAYTALARFYLSQRRLDEARQQFETVAAKHPKNEAAGTMVAIILQLQNKKAEARTQYERVLAQTPNAPIAANNLAWLYSEEGVNLDVALQLAQTAKGRMPNEPTVSDTLGFVYLKKNLPSLAVGPLEEAVKASPNDPRFLYRLAVAKAQTGDKGAARTLLNRALASGVAFEESAEAKALLASL